MILHFYNFYLGEEKIVVDTYAEQTREEFEDGSTLITFTNAIEGVDGQLSLKVIFLTYHHVQIVSIFLYVG